MSFEQPTSSLHSPAVAMADPRTYVADRDSNLPKTGCFFVASPAVLSCMIPGQLLYSQQAGSRPVSPRPSRDSTRPLYFILGRAITLDVIKTCKRVSFVKCTCVVRMYHACVCVRVCVCVLQAPAVDWQ